MFVLVRAVTYVTLFGGLVLVVLPAQLLSPAGIRPPEALGAAQVTGSVIAIGGGMMIQAGGSILAGIGVSGAPAGDADDVCAIAGIGSAPVGAVAPSRIGAAAVTAARVRAAIVAVARR